MENYVISEVIDFDCDDEGLLTVTFRIDGDPDDSYRTIEDNDYYYYAEDLCKDEDTYLVKEWDDGDNGDGYYYTSFEFREWKDYEHSEDTVREFLYEYYPEKKDLPKLDNG